MILFRPVYPGWIECISPQEFLSGALMFLAIAWHAFKKSPPIRDRLEWDVMVSARLATHSYLHELG